MKRTNSKENQNLGLWFFDIEATVLKLGKMIINDYDDGGNNNNSKNQQEAWWSDSESQFLEVKTNRSLLIGSLTVAFAMLIVVLFASAWKQQAMEWDSNSDTQLPLNAIVDVKDFGATGDGISKDTKAVANAIAALRAAGGGLLRFSTGCVFLPSIVSFNNKVVTVLTSVRPLSIGIVQHHQQYDNTVGR